MAVSHEEYTARGWIGVDLDGTLAHYDQWVGHEHIGAPVPAMVERVKRWLSEGRDVRIFTARLDGLSVRDYLVAEIAIQQWCNLHLGHVLPITCRKDRFMAMLWDDRCVQVIPNTGMPVVESTP